MPSKLAKVLQSKDETAQWLTGVPKGNTPLEEATDAARIVAYVVNTLSVQPDELLECLLTILSAMHTSAGIKYPNDIGHVEAPTEDEVTEAYETLSCMVDTESALESLSHNMNRAIDVINEWYALRYPEDENEE